MAGIARRMLLRGAAGSGLAALGHAARAERPPDVLGWDDARWGMTLRTLDGVFAGRIRVIDPPLVFGPYIAPRVVDRVAIGGVRFVALLQLDPARRQLAQVLLQFRGSRPTPNEGVAVRIALAAQLGPPDGRDEDSDYSGTFPSYAIVFRWVFPTTRVVLRYVDPYGESDRRVRKELLVRYSPTSGRT